MHVVPGEPPQGLRVTKVSTDSVALVWTAPPLVSQNGAIIGYTVKVLKIGGTSMYVVSKKAYTTVTSLEGDTTYNFMVAANTSVGVGPYTEHITAKTKNYGEITNVYINHKMCCITY